RIFNRLPSPGRAWRGKRNRRSVARRRLGSRLWRGAVDRKRNPPGGRGGDHPLSGHTGSAVFKLLLFEPNQLRRLRHRSRLSAEIDRHVVTGHLAVKQLDELLPLLHLPLEDPAKIALVLDDVGGEEEKQVGLHLLAGLIAEQVPEDGDVAEDGDLG